MLNGFINKKRIKNVKITIFGNTEKMIVELNGDPS
jgi:hypothetical protein